MRITLKTRSATYPVIIAPRALETFPWPSNAVVITDAVVQRRYGELWRAKARRFPILSFPAGEIHKRLSTIEHLCEQLVRAGADRATSLVAFGGGVVGDVVGLVASVYMRGVPLYHVPTTLLAMVDSSLGGKTGVDLAAGKNLVGTFYQPRAVIMDPRFVIDLPNKQFQNGLAEVLKHGVIHEPLFNWLEKNAAAIKQRDPQVILQMIVKNVRVKAQVAASDERESGRRMVLNLGHTFGHAIEQLSHFTVSHGDAVAIGVHYAVHYAQNQGNPIDVDRVAAVWHQFGLPTRLARPYAPRQMVRVMMADKKNRAHRLTLVVPRAIGRVHIQSGIDPRQIERFLRTYHASL